MLAIPIALVVMIILWPGLWARFIQNEIEVGVVLGTHQVTVGESIPMTVLIRNRSWLPCPFTEVTIELPQGLSVDEKGNGHSIQLCTYLLMRQEVQFRMSCYARKRGLHSFANRNLTVRLNEGLGFRDLLISQLVQAEVAVLPRFIENSVRGSQIQELMGKVEVTRWLYPDETLLRGIRVYQTGDAFKHISWQASARTGRWMTKQFSSSTEATVLLLVNAQFDEPHWQGTNPDEFERLCSLAATWARALQAKGTRFQFATNAAYPNRPKQRWYGEQRSEGIRTLLGHVQSATNCDFAEILKEAIQHGNVRGPVIVFSSFITAAQWRLLQHMVATGHTVTVVAGPLWDQSVMRLPGFHFVASSQATWGEGVRHA